MPKPKKILILVAVGVQCAALGAMCWQREAALRSGAPVFMRTAPVDPRDLFRGDYVRLTYDVSAIPIDRVAEDEVEAMRRPEKRVYLSYQTDARNMVIPLKLSLKKPQQERFIRGYTQKDWRPDVVAVRYGVEKYFMQQGRGRDLERSRTLEGVRIPLEMEVAVDRDNGIAVLKGYRYTELGLGIVLPRRASGQERPEFKVQVKLANASPQPLRILDPEDHRSFRIELSSDWLPRNQEKIRFQQPSPPLELYQASDVKIIPPRSLYQFEIDLDQPRYQLVRGATSIDWDEMQSWETARIVYQTPDPALLSDLDDTWNLWQGRAVSRAFSGTNFRD
ncbi:MAG: GDYXXLXY domain-containing protein [Desulfobacterales bacterium]|nr:MAG: GDYXXLXY domain-containing protein [Desulfobacterales bacterium]